MTCIRSACAPTCILWGVICVKFNGHNVHLNLQHGCIYLNSQNAIMHAQPVKMQAQLVNMHAQPVNMHAQHAYCQHACTTCQHACTTCQHACTTCQHACTTCILSTCMHNMHTVNMHAQHACTTCILSTCMHNMHAQHACTTCMHNMHTVNMHAQYTCAKLHAQTRIVCSSPGRIAAWGTIHHVLCARYIVLAPCHVVWRTRLVK